MVLILNCKAVVTAVSNLIMNYKACKLNQCTSIMKKESQHPIVRLPAATDPRAWTGVIPTQFLLGPLHFGIPEQPSGKRQCNRKQQSDFLDDEHM